VAVWADGFTRVGAFTLTMIGLIVVVIHAIEVVAASVGRERLSGGGAAGAARAARSAVQA
jgi:hypothetical protein